MRSVELFSGCGGLALGMAQAGFRHIRMIEWNAEACATLARNKAAGVEHVRDWPFLQGDVRKIDWRNIRDRLDLVGGGPPCQPFSIGGKHKGEEDARDMWPEAIRAVRELCPRAFLFENVRGLTRPAFAAYLARITANLRAPGLMHNTDETRVEHLRRLGATKAEYEVIVIKVNAADFGAAQKRHRIVVAGIRRDLNVTLTVPLPTHSRKRLLWDQWISGEYWQRYGMRRPVGGPASDTDRRLVAYLRQSGQRPDGLPWRTVRDALFGLGDPDGLRNHIFQDGAKVYPGHTGSPLDEPAKALKAGDHGVPGGENMMVRADGSVRYFTIREAARLQGLPDDWLFPSSWTESMRQLGNAVPVELAHAMAKWMAATLRRYKSSRRAA